MRSNVVPWLRQHCSVNIFRLRAVLLGVGLVSVLAMRAPKIMVQGSPPMPWTSQLQTFVDRCAPMCEAGRTSLCAAAYSDAKACQAYCNSMRLSYYTRLWPKLPVACDRACLAFRPHLCGQRETCRDACSATVRAAVPPLGRAEDVVLEVPSPGGSFWATLVVVLLATTDLMASLVLWGPQLRASEADIYDNKYDLSSKLWTLLESPTNLPTLCKMCYEIKVLCFDDADGNGLAITVLLQLLTLLHDHVPVWVARWRQRAQVQEPPQASSPDSPQPI
ncbi:hypothetical protein SPRG_13068 [Saprolegnia parasitica CBS 223.65]|uniref:Uncharacterized protein n=1 Tax=Saprolegnia parasitica (strain CBS 223.65) TaxID=695850 RepID=A0A067BNY3_SAPPC|nr:hypothetical protein SPRG_13068 [Saprolegnia parasitica CBS 223.65]KDO19963.1 hypothetical protein SPRG_13068 [Saprolegnia parasitica CBS 223.65]|eukprot:XP_012209333.1 hypothetical protein SPRG_13068 [Saprolegnia parasitica CBS 223.65]